MEGRRTRIEAADAKAEELLLPAGSFVRGWEFCRASDCHSAGDGTLEPLGSNFCGTPNSQVEQIAVPEKKRPSGDLTGL
jgi:hypothetical protein